MNTYLRLISIFLFTACSNYAQTSGDVLADDFSKSISEAGVQLLDCRTAGEFRSGHLQGALQADWTDASQFAERTQFLDKTKPVYVYCLSGSRSGQAANMLRSQGFTQVVNLKGGLIAWKKSGRELVSGKSDKPETTPEQYKSLVASAPLVLVDFGAEWCPPCRKMDPVIESFMKEQEGRVKLVKMDGGVENQLMKLNMVEALPTFIVYKEGKETARKQGVMTREELAELTR
jgi:thioredoxin